jgi:pimeloyl-ACP methyl ester carboxylesterase
MALVTARLRLHHAGAATNGATERGRFADGHSVDDSDVFRCIHAGPFPDLSGLEGERRAELQSVLDRMYRALGAWDWRGIATRLTMSTLIIHGGFDLIGVEWARQWALLAGEARLLVLGGATRYPWLEYPGHFTAALAHFLQPA